MQANVLSIPDFDPDRLRLRELIERFATFVPSISRLLKPAPRRRRIAMVEAVYPDNARFDITRKRMGATHVARPDGGGEPERACAGDAVHHANL